MERRLSRVHKCSLIEIIPELVNKDINDVNQAYVNGVLPSTFMSEMQLTTEQRYDKLIKSYRKYNSNSIKQNIQNIEVIPSQIIFQNFKGNYVYNIIITVINVSKNPCPLRVLFKSCPYFLLRYHTTHLPLKLAPGMEMQFNLQFTPEETRDYKHQVTFVSCDEKYTIPITAIAPRPLLDLPDEIIFPESPVNISCDKHILVKNLANVAAVYKIKVNPPFFIKPESGTIDGKDTMQLRISFIPIIEGSYKNYFFITYDTGECLKIKLFGIAISAVVHLEKDKLRFFDTYMGLKTEKTIRLFNKSKHIVHFQWKQYSSNIIDVKEIELLKECSSKNQVNCASCNIENCCQDKKSFLVNERIIKDNAIYYEKNENLLYFSSCFQIIPVEGEIYPENDIMITIIFCPNKAMSFESVAYCEVSGRSDRFPLKLEGTGLGPKFELNLEKIDLKTMYVYTVQCLEVCVVNKGNIPGTISFYPTESEFGNQITCQIGKKPIFLEPFEFGAFILELSCTREGKFVEEIKFLIHESNKIISFISSGLCIFPKLSVDTTDINFGHVAAGYTYTKNIILFNNTCIEIPFHVLIESDGEIPAVTNEEYFGFDDFHEVKNPKEYSCKPDTGAVARNSSLTLTLTLLPNLYRTKTVNLIVKVWNNEDHKISIGIKHHASVPKIIAIPNDIVIRFCFINYPANRVLNIKNESQLNCTFKILCLNEPNNNIFISSDMSTVYLEANETISVSLEIIVKSLGIQQAKLYIVFFGNQKLPLCNIACTGQGPVVLLEPDLVDFKEINLLSWKTNSVTLLNDSPIPAYIQVDLRKCPEMYIKVDPEEIVLEPESSASCAISIYLNDNRAYKHIINFNIQDRFPIRCQILAKGVGTCIESIPDMKGEVDLGPVLTKQIVQKQFILKNKGVRFHKILIARKSTMRTLKNYEEIPSVFTLSPNSFNLKPNEEITITLTGHRNNPEIVSEDFYFHAIIENMDKRQIIFENIIKAEFVLPLLKFSQKHMCFRVDYGVEQTTSFVKDIVDIVNKSKLKLTINIRVKPPFYICKNDGLLNELQIELEDEQIDNIEVFFNLEANDKKSFIASGCLEFSYIGHPHIDRIPLKAEVNYPNIYFNPTCIDFCCSPVASKADFNVELKNISPLNVSYWWEWDENECYFFKLPAVEELLPVPVYTKSVSDVETSILSESEILFMNLEEEVLPEISKKSKKEKGKKESKEDKKSNKSDKKSNKSDKKSEKKTNKKLDKKSDKTKKTDKTDKSKIKEKKKGGKPLPVIVIHRNYHTEEYFIDQQILIILIYREPITVMHLIEESTVNELFTNKMRQYIFPILKNTYNCDPTERFMFYLSQEEQNLSNVTEILDLVPTRGFLLPYENQLINFSFRPVDDMYIKIKALCHIAGGPTESFDITGTSAEIHYHINQTVVDFHRQVFCEVCQKNIQLVNSGYIPFTFATSSVEEAEMEYSEHLLEVGWLTVQPREGVLQPNCSIELNIRYFPGIAGKFSECFNLEIGHLPPVKIRVEGYGVFPQVYLSLPRPSMEQLSTLLCYEAIATMTQDFLVYVEDIKVWCHTDNTNFEYDISKSEKRALKKDGWCIISYDKTFPSVMDIDLAIERMMACKHIQAHPHILADHTILQKTCCIPQFYIPPYLVNFEYVLPETLVHYTILALNYGPTDIQMRLVNNFKKTGILDAGFTIQFNKGKLKVGKTFPIHIIFFASIEKYPERRHDLNYMIYLEVKHGPRIPVIINAIVTRPFIETSETVLNFGEVICGQCKMMNFIMKNVGYIPCQWKATLKEIRKKPTRYKEKIPKEPCMFYLRTTSGVLEPNEEFLFDVFLEPTKTIVIDWLLTITVENNTSETFAVSLKGVGIIPELQFNNNYLEFASALPFTNESTKIIKITNPCTFPIEFYFSDFDNQIIEEENLLRILSQYYCSDDLYIPPRLAGNELPPAFKRFYDELYHEVEIELEKVEHEELPISQPHPEKKIKKKKNTTVDSSSDKELKVSRKSFSNPILFKNDTEIEELIKEHITKKIEMRKYDDFLDFKDPIRSAIAESKGPLEEPDPTALKEGIAIICYGAPFTEYLYAANKLAKACNLPVLTIDSVIIEALVENKIESCIRMNNIIDDAFNDLEDINKEPIVSEDSTKADLFDDIKSKIDMITNCSNNTVKQSKQSSPKKKESNKGSEKSAKKNKKHVFDTFIGIPEEYLEDALKYMLAKYTNGFLIDNLNSLFLKKPIVALMTLLRAIGNTKYIQFVIVYNSFEQQDGYLESLRNLELQKAEELKCEKLKYFDEITPQEFELLCPEDLALYKTVYLARRKERTAERLKMLQEKKEVKKNIKSKTLHIKSRDKISTASKSKLKKSAVSEKKSDKTSGSKKSAKHKLPPHKIELLNAFANFETDFHEMLHILEYWNRKECVLLKSYIPKKSKPKPKKAKSPKKSVKSKSPGKEDSPDCIEKIIEVKECDPKYGIPFWIVNDRNKQDWIVNIFGNVINNYQEYLNAQDSLKKKLKPGIETSTDLFSVVHNPKDKRIRTRTDVFDIELREQETPEINLETIEDLPRERDSILASIKSLNLDELVKDDSVITNKVIKVKKSKNFSKVMYSDSYLTEKMPFATRYILNPKESIEFQIKFIPVDVSIYEHSYFIELVGWSTKYQVDCFAICDIPKIDMDPVVLFSSVIHTKTPKYMYTNNLYIKSANIFDFGNAFVIDKKGDHNSSHGIETGIQLKNISTIPAEITFYFEKNNSAFQKQPNNCIIKPNEYEYVVINATPTEIGPNYNKLFLVIKDNPKVEVINLVCNGTALSYELSTKKISFDRVQLNKIMKKYLHITNTCNVPITWKFSNSNILPNKIDIFPIYGHIKPNNKNEIIFTYMSDQVEEIKPTKLNIEILEENNQCIPLQTESIDISAETCELNILVEPNIDFHDVKARGVYTHIFTFQNVGKYQLQFEIENLDRTNLDKKETRNLNMFRISTTSGTLPAHKVTTTTITFEPSKEVILKEFPIYKCFILDNIEKNNIRTVQTFYITVSAKTYFSSFEICPSSEIHFGPLLIYTPKTETLLIKNTGKFDFNYNILSKDLLEELQKRLEKNRGAKPGSKGGKKGIRSTSKPSTIKASTKSTKSKDTKSNNKTKEKVAIITYGPFQITNYLGVIKPNESKEIIITCNLKDIGPLEDILYIFISECETKYGMGIPLKLISNGCLPSVNFEDINFIFKELIVANSNADTVNNQKHKKQSTFTIEDNTILFNKICINTVETTKIHFYNNGFIMAELISKIDNQIFNISPDHLDILPYEEGVFTISFSPKLINDYKGTLQITLVHPPNYKSLEVIYNLKGKGGVPQITVLEPRSDDVINSITFNPTLVGTISTKSISFMNSGDLSCKVIIEVINDENKVFVLKIDDMREFLTYYNKDDEISMRRQSTVNLMPGDMVKFNLIYNPTCITKDNCCVKLHIICNPFELHMINVVAESFMEDVILEGLDTTLLLSENKNSNIDLNSTKYIIDFGSSYIKDLQKFRFKIYNQSLEFIYKFHFKSIPEVTFTPSVGHLRPLAKKEIIATFMSTEPVLLSELPLQCIICKIEFEDVVTNDSNISNVSISCTPDNKISWDERQELILYDTVLQEEENSSSHSINTCSYISVPRSAELNSEPSHQVVPDSYRNIYILIFALANYSSYSCGIDEIRFKDTFIYEKRKYTFSVENSGNINLNMKWDMESTSVTKLNSNLLRSISNDDAIILRPSTTSSLKTSIQCMKKKIARPLSNKEKFIILDIPNTNDNTNTVSLTVKNAASLPFTITPQSATILPNEKCNFTIKFSPLEIFEYKILVKGKIDNLVADQKNINIKVYAKSTMPYCHFDVKFSDYLTSGRRDVKKCDITALDMNTKVIEFNCLGVGILHKKKFNIVNPTEDDLYFTWDQLKSHEISSVTLFHCENLNGKIQRGRQFEVCFSILPQLIGTFEALYNFKIEKYNAHMQFLLVANVKESEVYFYNTHLQMKPTVLGITVCDYVILKNDEDEIIEFNFRKSSFYSEGRRQGLIVEPKKGIIPKQGEVRIKICYSPTEYGEASFKLKCSISYRLKPICLDVSTTCYEVEPMVLYSLSDGKRIIVSSDFDNIIDFGMLIPHHAESIKIYIQNAGKLGFYFQWEYNDDIIDRNFHIEITGIEGYVKMDTEISSIINIIPIKNGRLKNFKMYLKIRYGPTYKFLINGIASKSLFKFSFTTYNFGPCCIQNGPTTHYHKILEFYNYGLYKIVLDCNYMFTDYLSVDYKIKEIPPKSKEYIPIYFHPQKCEKYNEDLKFYINSEEVKIKITGEGVGLNVFLEDSTNKCIDLGCPLIGQCVKKVVRVVNKSAAAIDVIFNIWDELPCYKYPTAPKMHYINLPLKKTPILEEKMPGKKDKEKIDKNKKKDEKSKQEKTKSKSTKSRGSKLTNVSKDKMAKKSKIIINEEPEEIGETEEEIGRRLVKCALSISPKKEITIFPNKAVEFTIKYCPTQRMKSFMEKISMQVFDRVQTLCVVKGCCLGLEFSLDRNVIPFGAVVLNCERESKLMLLNTGDIGAKFKWEIEDNEIFSITPNKGYSSSGMTVTFSVKFHPTILSYDIDKNFFCYIDGYNPPLSVRFIGSCVNLPEPTGILQFNCPVRTEDQKPIVIYNPSSTDWKIFPLITGDYFTTKELLIVPAKSSETCIITYKPLVMCKENIMHKGSVFFKTTGDNGIVYELVGNAEMPVMIDRILREIPCKTNHTEILLVKNWLRKPQKLQVVTEDITPGNTLLLYKIESKEFIDILSDGLREYIWNIYVYKECSLEFKVTFTNQENEYLYYIISLKVTKPSPLDSFKLSTCIRCSAYQDIKLINPLDREVIYTIKSSFPDLKYPNPVIVQPHSEDIVQIEFKPVILENKITLLEANCFELGTFPYEFDLTSFPPNPEPPIYLDCAIGETIDYNIPIKNHSKSKATFNCELENKEDFTINTATLSVNPDQIVNLTVKFNPQSFEDVITTLIVSSPIGGDYTYKIFGKCSLPTPKGPFTIKSNTDLKITFRNPFPVKMTFTLVIDPDVFIIKSTEETFNPKETRDIIVRKRDSIPSLEDINDNIKISGKITICPKEPSLAHIKWNYYLQDD